MAGRIVLAAVVILATIGAGACGAHGMPKQTAGPPKQTAKAHVSPSTVQTEGTKTQEAQTGSDGQSAAPESEAPLTLTLDHTTSPMSLSKSSDLFLPYYYPDGWIDGAVDTSLPGTYGWLVQGTGWGNANLGIGQPGCSAFFEILGLPTPEQAQRIQSWYDNYGDWGQLLKENLSTDYIALQFGGPGCEFKPAAILAGQDVAMHDANIYAQQLQFDSFTRGTREVVEDALVAMGLLSKQNWRCQDQTQAACVIVQASIQALGQAAINTVDTGTVYFAKGTGTESSFMVKVVNDPANGPEYYFVAYSNPMAQRFQELGFHLP